LVAEGVPMSTPPSMAAMGPDWYQSEPGLVIDFCTSPGRTGNSTYRGLPYDLRPADYTTTTTTITIIYN